MGETVKALSQTVNQSNAALSAQVHCDVSEINNFGKRRYLYSKAFLTNPPSDSYLSHVSAHIIFNNKAKLLVDTLQT